MSAAASATAQTTGAIEGTVVGANGNALPGVLVTVTGSGAQQESVTGTDGSYRFAGLAAGDYVVTAMLPGYQTAEFQVTVGAGTAQMVPIVLRVAYLLDTISVVAEEPRIFARNFVAEPMMRQHYVRFSGEALSDLLRSTEFSIVANNVGDKAYLSAITENAAWLGAPRTISMTATISF